jgi:hypothetical protein
LLALALKLRQNVSIEHTHSIAALALQCLDDYSIQNLDPGAVLHLLLATWEARFGAVDQWSPRRAVLVRVSSISARCARFEELRQEIAMTTKVK